jgi:hypothetical protein
MCHLLVIVVLVIVKILHLCLKFRRVKQVLFSRPSLIIIIPLWNCVCKAASPADLRSLIMFKSFLSRTYLHLITTILDVDMTCTWSLHRTCSCHRN